MYENGTLLFDSESQTNIKNFEISRDKTSIVASDPDNPRLSKRMAELGLCSRREADEWISNGWVKVNGKIIDELGTRVSRDDKIDISKQAEKHQSEIVTILLNKPIGYVSGQAEDGYEPAIVLIHPDNQWKDDPLLHHAQPREFHRSRRVLPSEVRPVRR